jgi:hypothetical protein
VQLIEVHTSYGTIAAREQALIDAVRAILVVEGGHRASVEDLVAAVTWDMDIPEPREDDSLDAEDDDEAAA